MSNSEMTCAIPADQLADVVSKIEAAGGADLAVAGYAAEDARRFPPVN